MRTLKRQAGLSLLGILTIVALFSFFLTVVIRLLPVYMEGRAVRTALETVVEASNTEQSLREVTKRINSQFNVNRIEVLKPSDVKVYRDKGKIFIDANFETRTPLFENVDAVLMFNDNNFVIE